MKNKKLIDSWNKIEPGEAAEERMLSAILEENRRVREEEGDPASGQAGNRVRRFRWGYAAACLALLVLVGTVGFAVSAEAKEYQTAVAFFEENGLSAEGLSRSEVKAVYRDITEKRFSYGKTAEVIRHAVPGWELQERLPTPEELAAVWDKNVWAAKFSNSQYGISCRIDQRYRKDESRGFEVLDRSVVECCRDGKPLWTAEFTDFYVEDCTVTNAGTMVWGRNEVWSTSDITCGWIALVGNDGRVLWQLPLRHGFKYEYVASVLYDGDGTWAVISRGDMKNVCLSRFDQSGKELSFRKTEVGNYGISNAASLGDGYILQLWNQSTGDTALLYKMDRDGVLTDSFSYEADDADYYITDMIEFGGQVYLSAYAVPKQKDEGGRHDIANILDYIFSKTSKSPGNWEITSEELTPVVRENYTALLLVCDPDGGAPKTFYSVKGSLGSDLSVNNIEQLLWKANSITSTFFSPATSSFSIGGTCKVFLYTFDAAGNLVEQEDTGETDVYRR